MAWLTKNKLADSGVIQTGNKGYMKAICLKQRRSHNMKKRKPMKNKTHD